MTRDQAIDYIKAHPAQFKGATIDEVLAKTQSSNDADYFNPTMYVPEQGKTVYKPNSPTRGATVSPPKPTTPAPKPAPLPSMPITPTDVRQGLFSSKIPALPVLLSLGLIALGTGMVIYRVSK